MVTFNTFPETLVKVGLDYNDLEKIVNKFSENLCKISFGLGNTIKYCLFKEKKEPYLLIISQQKNKLKTSYGYNIILTITSYLERKNKEIADKFKKEAGIDLNLEVPEQLKKASAVISIAFPVFGKNPKSAMALLGG